MTRLIPHAGRHDFRDRLGRRGAVGACPETDLPLEIPLVVRSWARAAGTVPPSVHDELLVDVSVHRTAAEALELRVGSILAGVLDRLTDSLSADIRDHPWDGRASPRLSGL